MDIIIIDKATKRVETVTADLLLTVMKTCQMLLHKNRAKNLSALMLLRLPPSQLFFYNLREAFSRIMACFGLPPFMRTAKSSIFSPIFLRNAGMRVAEST